MNLPYSDSQSRDDVFLSDCDHFNGREVVVTEKLDGENTNLYGISEKYPEGHFHARSLETKHHPSRTYMKVILSRIAHQIPEGYRICGENVYAYHSIFYTELTSYFFVFSIWDEDNCCLPWEDTVEYCEMLSLPLAPVIYKGEWDEEKIKSLWTGEGKFDTFDSPKCEKVVDAEGYVVRVNEPFGFPEFKAYVGKYVRKNHVQTDEHWMMREVVRNRLKD
jgi:hypothetical protein